MLSKLKSLFGKSPPAESVEESPEVAVAALLLEAARADETYDERERVIIETALAAEFGLDPQAAAALRARGEEEQAKSMDIHRHTKVAKALPTEAKARLIEALWRIALSDRDRDAFEDTLIRRVCGLIYFSDVESGAARQRVENELQPARDS